MTTEGKIKLMIVDDHQMFIDGVKSLLRKEKQFEFIAEANTGEEALRLMESMQPDILITDISMPGMSGNELIEKVKAKNPEIKILVLSMHNEAEVISEIMMQEAEGYILKNTGRQELSSALHKIADGGTFYSDEVLLSLMRKVKKEAKRDKEVVQLSERELEVVRLVVQEMSNEEIAGKLFISKRTVETHRKNINQKTNMKTVVGLIKFAIRNEIASA
jgi:DNA-binding NarL/FixJ family response regulator